MTILRPFSNNKSSPQSADAVLIENSESEVSNTPAHSNVSEAFRSDPEEVAQSQVFILPGAKRRLLVHHAQFDPGSHVLTYRDATLPFPDSSSIYTLLDDPLLDALFLHVKGEADDVVCGRLVFSQTLLVTPVSLDVVALSPDYTYARS